MSRLLLPGVSTVPRAGSAARGAVLLTPGRASGLSTGSQSLAHLHVKRVSDLSVSEASVSGAALHVSVTDVSQRSLLSSCLSGGAASLAGVSKGFASAPGGTRRFVHGSSRPGAAGFSRGEMSALATQRLARGYAPHLAPRFARSSHHKSHKPPSPPVDTARAEAIADSKSAATAAAKAEIVDDIDKLPPHVVEQLSFVRRHPLISGCVITPIVLTVSVALIVAGLLAYDATTYADRHIENVPVNPVALAPMRGGRKNLKIAQYLVDDDETDEHGVVKPGHDKPRLVIVGGGWGSVAILKHLRRDDWHVTVVSPQNYFLFHPLLPSATVGTIELRSLVEPLRKIIARVGGHFLHSTAVDVDFDAQLLEVACPNGGDNYYVPYDKLVIACGSVNRTFGVPGLENCFQLKTVGDAQAVRRRVMDNLEAAALPSTSEAERERLLSFVVCGGGPTGVEFASELYDMLNEDVLDYMPKILREKAKVHIIQSRDHILNTYAESISHYAERKFARDNIDTVLNSRVKQVTPTSVVYQTKDSEGRIMDHEVPSGLTLWSTGIDMNAFTRTASQHLPNQYHKHALEVDSHLRVIGAPLGTVYALGDCATIETRLVDHLLDMIELCDENKDDAIDEKELTKMMNIVYRKFPTAKPHFEQIKDVFQKYGQNSNSLTLNQVAQLFMDISKNMTALPATAQVANQQGNYLGKKFNAISRSGLYKPASLTAPPPPELDAAQTRSLELATPTAAAAAAANSQLGRNAAPPDLDDEVYRPFHYRHMGSLAYIGNSAVFDIENHTFAGGLVAMYLWRSIYMSEQVSFRNRVLIFIDYVKRGIWGRDLSRF